jgi:hypothetical protein
MCVKYLRFNQQAQVHSIEKDKKKDHNVVVTNKDPAAPDAGVSQAYLSSTSSSTRHHEPSICDELHQRRWRRRDGRGVGMAR